MSYLVDDDPEILPPLDEEEEARRRALDMAPGVAPIPNRQVPTPDLPDGALPQMPMRVPGNAPVVDKYNAAASKVADITGQKPLPDKPKWWQRLAAAGVGFGAGYSNAAGRNRNPIDPSAAEHAILAPGYDRKLASWQQQMDAANANLKAADLSQTAWWKNRQENSQEDLQQAEAERNRKMAEYESGRNKATIEGKRIADAQAQDKLALKGREEDAFIVQDGEQPPQGWGTYTSKADPKTVYAVPPRLMKVTEDLAPYVAGRKVGDYVPWSEFRKAQDAANKERQIAAHPVKPPADNVERILLNPHDYAPEQVAQARSMFAASHRDPNAPPGSGGGPMPSRSPLIPPTDRDEGVLGSAPDGTKAIIKQIVDYKYPLPSGMALRTPYWQNVLGLAAQYDPSFDASQYQNRQRTRNDYMSPSGKAGQAIGALNTVTDHLDRLEKNFKSLNNFGGLLTPLNGVTNKVESTFGDARQPRAEMDIEAVANELMRAWRQVGASDTEIKAWRDKISPNMSPEAQAGVINEAYELINGKIRSLKTQYEQAMGRPADFRMLNPEVVKRMKAHGVDVADLAQGAAYRNQNPTQGGQPQGAAPGGAPAKTASVADVHAYAQAHPGMSDAEAQELFKGKGYVIR